MPDALTKLNELQGEIADLGHAAAVLNWDQQTYMPAGGGTARAAQLATLQRLAHQIAVSDEMAQALQDAEQARTSADPDSDEARLIRKARRDFEKSRKVPADWVATFARATSLAHQTWAQARADSDFGQFAPSLAEIIQLRRDYVEFFAPYDHPYDPLLDDFEPGMKTSAVQEVFNALRPAQVDLVSSIQEHGKPIEDAVLRQPFDVRAQWAFGEQVIRAFGYDFTRGRQDKSAHPFTTSFSVNDVRITTRLDPNFFNTALFGTLHEAGHALYEQGIQQAFERTPLANAASLAVHESQSRLWENLVGRSLTFWKSFYPELQRTFPTQFGESSLDAFYGAINKVEPSLVRVEADEATYNLHIMLRFEIELGLLDGSIEITDLPEIWNQKMQEYLGVRPTRDAEGVLQDVHWSAGYFGYFATYALGNLLAAQLMQKIQSDIPDFEGQIEHAQFEGLLTWLRENIHQHGAKFEPLELMQRVTGEGLTAEPYLQYLRMKFGELYAL